MDFDDDGKLGIPDILGLLIRTFVPGSADPPAPYPDCGVDATEDELLCDVSTKVCQ